MQGWEAVNPYVKKGTKYNYLEEISLPMMNRAYSAQNVEPTTSRLPYCGYITWAWRPLRFDKDYFVFYASRKSHLHRCGRNNIALD